MESMEAGSPVPTRAKSALTPQDHMIRRSARNSRVHFDEDGYIPQQLIEENPIIVQVTGEEQGKTIGVYLGFLQEVHKYEVKFSIPWAMVEGYLLMSLPSASPSGPKDQIKIQVAESGDDGVSTTNASVNSASSNSSENGKSREESFQQNQQPQPRTSSTKTTKSNKFLEILELTVGELSEVTSMEWIVGKAAGLQVHMDIKVPSTKDQHVLEDTFFIRCDSVERRFIRINIAAKIMGKTMGTPTLKDGIKCTGLAPNVCDSSSESESEDSEENEVDMKDVPQVEQKKSNS